MLGVRPHLGRLLRSDLDAGLDAQPAAVISHSLWQRRFGGDPAIVGRLARFGNANLPVAGVGLFAALSYAVGRRMREFGIRLALGAGRRDMFSLVLRQSFLMTTAGTGAGLIGAFFVARLLQSQIYGVSPGDPLTLLASALFALAIALAASLQPAARAVRVDPVTALRCD